MRSRFAFRLAAVLLLVFAAGCASTDAPAEDPAVPPVEPPPSTETPASTAEAPPPDTDIIDDVEALAREYIRQPPLYISDLGDEVPLRTSRPVVEPNATEAEKGRFVFMPIPFIDPTIGAGIGAAVGYVYRPDLSDPGSPPSIIGLGGFFSSNGSWGGAMGWRGSIDDDNWRFLVGAGISNIEYGFYGIGTEAGDRDETVPLVQREKSILGQLMGRLDDTVYLGPRVWFRNTRNQLQDFDRSAFADLPPPGTELNAKVNALGLRLDVDTRDAEVYPTSGQHLSIIADVFASAWGSDFNYQIYRIGYSHYESLGGKDVLALRAYGRFTGGDVPFFDLGLFGKHSDLRGYVIGQYRDRMLIALQGEYRHQFSERWGAVAFLGVGEVSPRITYWDLGDLLPSVGVGGRLTLDKQSHLNLRLDLAYGRAGLAISLGIAEVF